VLGGVDSGGVCEFFCVFELFLTLICHFGLICCFSCLLLVLQFCLLLDDLLKLFLAFWSSSYASCGIEFEVQTLCFLLSMDTSRGRLRNQVASSLV
jgi:hypothetical protein